VDEIVFVLEVWGDEIILYRSAVIKLTQINR